jgi:pimeloyl-ACP methyl ester carboxylesterase
MTIRLEIAQRFPGLSLRLFLLLSVVVWLCFVSALPGSAAQDPRPSGQEPPIAPPPSLNFCNFSGPFVRIASAGAGSEGLVVRVSPPSSVRYPRGAPIVVHMFSATPSVSGSLACLSEQGFVDVGFLCPGGQYTESDGTVWKSGGRGPADQAHAQNCIEPLADVLSFATGKTRSLDGKSIRDYTGRIHAMTDEVGLIGWSFGGTLATLAMARYGERFSGMKWFASWESPIAGTWDDGRGSRFQPNRFYQQNTDTVEFDRLRYDPEMPVWAYPTLRLQPQADWPRGGLFLDGDGNGRFNKDSDYAFWADVDLGPPFKVFYSPTVIRQAVERSVFGSVWPAHIASREAVDNRANEGDGLGQIPTAVRRFPRMAILVFESQQHHVRASDHSQTIAHVNAWLDARARWVRFNPDAHYVESAMGRKPSRDVQYPAGQKLDRKSIGDYLEPEESDGGPTDAEGMTAAACELADRTYHRSWAPLLPHVLVQQHNTAIGSRR